MCYRNNQLGSLQTCNGRLGSSYLKTVQLCIYSHSSSCLFLLAVYPLPTQPFYATSVSVFLFFMLQG